MAPLEASQSLNLAGLYWGAMPLPEGAVMLGCIYRNNGVGGALIRLQNGNYVQGNAGSIRSLDQKAAAEAARRATV